MSRLVRSALIIVVSILASNSLLFRPLWAQQTAVKARAARGIHANSTDMSIAPLPGEDAVPVDESSAPPASLSPEDRALVEAQMQFLQDHRISAVEDWTTKAVVASDPGTEEEAIRNGTHEHWLAVVSEPRYIMHALRHHLPVRGPGPAALLKFEQDIAIRSGQTWMDKDREFEPAPLMKLRRSAAGQGGPTTRDWNVVLGTAGVAPTMYPAKFDYDMGAPNCLKDYVVVGVNAVGSGTQPEIVGINNVYTFCNGGTPTVVFAYHTTTNGTVKTSPTLSLDGAKIAFVESITNASRLHVLTVGSTCFVVPGSCGTVAAPALPGTGNNAVDVSILLKGGRSVTRSSVFVDYNEDVNPCDTAFVGDDAGLLHAITPVFDTTYVNASGATVACPVTTPAEILTCGAVACQQGGWPLYVSGAYDSSDTAPILSGPSYDPISKNVFFGTSGVGGGLEFYARTVTASSGVCVNAAHTQTGAAPCIGGFYDAGIAEYFQTYGSGNNYNSDTNSFGDYQDPTLVDIVSEYTFWATGQSLEGYGLCTVNGAPLLTQISTNFATNPKTICGGLVGGNHLHMGALDNAYYNSTATGNLWMGWGDSIGTTAGIPALAYFCFGNTSPACSGSGSASNVLGKGYEVAPAGIGKLATTAQDSSPVTEDYDVFNGVDWLTISTLGNSCGGTGTAGACIWADNISPSASPFTCTGAACSYIPWTPNTVYGNGSEVVDTNGNLQKVTSAANAGISGSPASPAWLAAGNTVDGAPAAASATGTVVAGNIAPSVMTTAAGSFSFTAQPASYCASAYLPGIWVGNVHWYFASLTDTTYGTPNCYDILGAVDGDPVILIGTTVAQTAQNTAAAISGNASACGYSDPNTGDATYNTCFYVNTAGNAYATATATTSTVNLMSKVGGTAGNGTGSCYTNYGFEAYDTYDGEPDAENITPSAATCLTGGTGSAASSFSINGTAISASNPTYASATGAFSLSPNAGEVLITNGSNSEMLIPSVSMTASAVGKALGVGFTQGQTITITNGANSETVIASATSSADAFATFGQDPPVGSTVTITNGATLTLTVAVPNGTVGSSTGTATFSNTYAGGHTITVGSVVYEFRTNATYANACTADNTTVGAHACVNAGASAAETAQNFAAAVNANPANCGATDPGACFAFLSGPNPGAYATVSGAAVTIYNLTNGTLVFTESATHTNLTLNPTSGSLSAPAADTGTNFSIADNVSDLATKFAAAINRAGNGSSVGVGAVANSPSAGVVTVTATTAGTVGNSITLGGTATTAPALGWVEVLSEPCDWPNHYCGNTGTTPSITIGAVTYPFVDSSPAAGTEQIWTDDEDGLEYYGYYYPYQTDAGVLTNLILALNDKTGEWFPCGYCTQYDPTTSAFGTGITAANPAVTWSGVVNAALSTIYFTNVFKLIAKTGGAGGSFPLTTNYASGISVTGGTAPFGWSCPQGTTSSTMCGGSATGANTGVYFDVSSGMGATITANIAAALARNQTGVGVTTAGASGTAFTTTANAAGTAANSIQVGGTAVGPNFVWWYLGVPTTTLQGGTNGVTSATTFAVDGVLLDDASQLAQAINLNTTANGNVGVAATCAGYPACTAQPITVTASTPGTGGNGITLESTVAGFTWSGTNLTGGSSGTTSGTTFAYWGVSSELNAGAIAANMVTAINSNTTLAGLFPGVAATNTGGGSCASNCIFTVTATSNGTAGDYPLATTFANTTFYWTPSAAMAGGANGVIWTYQSPSNGESSVQRGFGTSGMIIETLDYPAWIANHMYATKSGVTDINGNNQLAIVGGNSGSGAPSWSTAAGSLTHDGTVTWECLGEASAANVYLGTGTGVGGDMAVKYTVRGLK